MGQGLDDGRQLHEAEDESQQWPYLHAGIRKAYQADGTIPNWESLEALIGGTRHGE